MKTQNQIAERQPEPPSDAAFLKRITLKLAGIIPAALLFIPLFKEWMILNWDIVIWISKQ